MYYKLEILWKDGKYEKIMVKRLFQQRPNKDSNIGNMLYYEDIYCLHGGGHFLNTDDMACWEVTL